MCRRYGTGGQGITPVMDVLVIGGGGTLGRLVCAEVSARGHTPLPFGRRNGDLRDPTSSLPRTPA